MDVTPSKLMFTAMSNLVDATVGGAPVAVDNSTGANERRIRRQWMFEILHQLVAISMREGVNRAIRDAKARLHGPEDGEDRNARAKAVDHAHAGTSIVTDLGSSH